MNQFLRFCFAGTIGFAVDAGILQVLVIALEANPYAARIPSFFAAASTTWLINRRYTFKSQKKPTHTEWAHYVCLMLFGAAVNYILYSLYITYWDRALHQPWLGVAIGSVGALISNFTTSKRVFHRKEQDAQTSHYIDNQR